MSDGLSLEKLRVADRLESLERTMSNYTAINELKMKQYGEMIEKLNHIIVGNGTKGLSESVRNLEDKEKNIGKHVWVFYTAIITGFGEWVWSTINHWGK